MNLFVMHAIRGWHRLRAEFIKLRLKDHAKCVQEIRHDLEVREFQVSQLQWEYERAMRLAGGR